MGTGLDGGRQNDVPAASRPTQELTLETILGYLQSLGFLDIPSVIEHGLKIEEVPGRNRNFRVIAGSGGGPSFFIKQAPRGEIGTSGPLAVEAALYDWIATDAKATHLRHSCPRRLHFDPLRSILILELVKEGTSLHDLEDQAPPPVLASLRRMVATAMAECHKIPVRDQPALAELLPREAPWVFGIARPAPASLRELAPGQLRLIQAIQLQPDVLARLAQVEAGWPSTHLIHGDFKWSNVLVEMDSAGAPVRVLLLDWEMAQLGDPAWDVGAALHAILAEAVLGVELPDGTNTESAAELLGAVIPTLHEAHRSLWQDYVTAAHLSDAEAGPMLDRLPVHVGARLIKSAYEWSQAEAEMPRRAAAILQLGINMLLRPEAARDFVLGFGGPARP